jgi:hypothetical protein
MNDADRLRSAHLTQHNLVLFLDQFLGQRGLQASLDCTELGTNIAMVSRNLGIVHCIVMLLFDQPANTGARKHF